MALQFTPSDEKKNDVIPAEATVVDTAEASKELNLKITEPQTYSIIDTANELKQELASSEEIDKLVSTINANDPNSIITFGNQVAEEISKASDQVLNSMNMTQLDDSSELLNALKNIMDQFDVKELTEEKKAGFFANLRKQLDKILAKYHTMGEEVDKIYVQLKQYESEISQSNIKLETMYNANIEYYKELLKYIMAGEQACKELDQYIEDFKVKVQNNPDSGTAAMDLQTLEQTRFYHGAACNGSENCGKCCNADRSHAQGNGIFKHQSYQKDKFRFHHHNACIQAGSCSGCYAQETAYPGKCNEGS